MEPQSLLKRENKESKVPGQLMVTILSTTALLTAFVSVGLVILFKNEVFQLESRLAFLESAVLHTEFMELDETNDVVQRLKRSADPDSSRFDGVRVVDEAYSGSFKSRRDRKLKLYESLDGNEVTQSESNEVLRPHHRISPVWSNDQSNSSPSIIRDTTQQSIPIIGNRKTAGNLVKSIDFGRRPNMMRRPSRVKRLHAHNGHRHRRRQHKASNYNLTDSVMFRPSLVKATERLNPPPSPPAPQPVKVHQTPSTYIKKSSLSKKKKKSNRKNRRQRNVRSSITVAHFNANNVSNSALAGDVSWEAAGWMDSFGLTRKYEMGYDGVRVKEAGLYHIYAQMQYNGGANADSFTVEQDDRTIFSCNAPTAVAYMGPRIHSCHTSATVYLPQNSKIRVQNSPSMTTKVVSENSFFGLMKLMDAPNSLPQATTHQAEKFFW